VRGDKPKPGQIVKEFVEDAKKEISDYKKEMACEHEVDDV
jgi:hypothetical protein|tara:strand:- start:70 stop:189 length:120 start_codon:yes stop_codon:yes gene_type:complete